MSRYMVQVLWKPHITVPDTYKEAIVHTLQDAMKKALEWADITGREAKIWQGENNGWVLIETVLPPYERIKCPTCKGDGCIDIPH